MASTEDPKTLLALVAQKLESLEARFMEWGDHIQAVVERLELRVAEDRERLLLLEDWRKAVDGRIKSVEDKFDTISNRLWLVFGGLLAVLVALVGNLLAKVAKGG